MQRLFLVSSILFVSISSLLAQEASLVIRHRPQEKVMRETWVEISALVGGKDEVESVFVSSLTGDGQPIRLDLTGTCRRVATELRVEKPNAAIREGADENFKAVANPAVGTPLSVVSYSSQRYYYQVLLEDNKTGWILDGMVKPAAYGEIYTGYLPQQALHASSLKYTISAVSTRKKIVTTPEYAMTVSARIQSLAPPSAQPPEIVKVCKSRWPYYIAGGVVVLGGAVWASIPSPEEKGDMSISVSW